MMQMKNFSDGIFVRDREELQFAGFKGDQSEKLFEDKSGRAWSILRFIVESLFTASHLILSVIFLFFFLTAICFSITCNLDLAFEMIYPTAPTPSRRNIMSVCLAGLLPCVIYIVILVLSLFWEVFRAVLFKNSLRFSIARLITVILVVIVSGVWAGTKVPSTKSIVYFPDFIKHAVAVSWMGAFCLSLLGSLLLIAIVYTDSLRNQKLLYLKIALSAFLVMFAIVSCVVFAAFADMSTSAVVFAFFVPIAVASTEVYTYYRGSYTKRTKFIMSRGVAVLFFTLYFAVITFIVSTVSTQTKCDTRCRESIFAKAWGAANRENMVTPRYPICEQTWSKSKLNIADMALLANLTYNSAMYSSNDTLKQAVLNQFLSQNNWSTVSFADHAPYYYHVTDSNNVHVIAIRGANTPDELIHYAKIWNEIAVIQSLSTLFPIIHQVPRDYLSAYVSASAFIDKLLHHGSTRQYFKTLEDYTQQLVRRNSEVILVGHSFGGGVAKLIAARLGVPGVAFSSPGVGLSHRKFDFELKTAARYLTTVYPESDVIPMIDRLTGQVQHVLCDGEDFTVCHAIEKTYCELRMGCRLLGYPSCPSVIYK
ncbi:uncharacterized protein LOC5516344 [Nematostella vectensis]|uniref:uncharacterized protein LOC5516344 n=1 Tax=Nematostella vectensis TaxID=45351 RepID=UPI0020772A69|nr:uncharacterized protein LOC5516344 [Nematostella vectensis]